MNFEETDIDGLFIVHYEKHFDLRGELFEFYNKNSYREFPIPFIPEQFTISKSSRGVIRGLHYRKGGLKQHKFVTCISGSILDAVVDTRITSNTFGKHRTYILEGSDSSGILLLDGLAHGFSVRSEEAVVGYGLTATFDPDYEFGINPLDEELSIDWQVDSQKNISAKDLSAESFSNYRHRIS